VRLLSHALNLLAQSQLIVSAKSYNIGLLSNILFQIGRWM